MTSKNRLWRRIPVQNPLYPISPSTVRTILRQAGLPSAPRGTGPVWQQFLTAQAHGILAIDFLHIDTALLKRIYVFFGIERATRWVHLRGFTEYPAGRWVTQQARNLMMALPAPFGFLLRGRDAKYPTSFDAVFHAKGITTVKTPIQAPRATRL